MERIRVEFLNTRKWNYQNHASTGPIPASALALMKDILDRFATDGELPKEEWEAMLTDLRARCARLVGAEPEEIALTQSTTRGLQIVLGAIPWQPGDNVVILKDNFPTNVYVWRNLDSKVEVRAAEGAQHAAAVENVIRLMDDRTRAVSVDWVHFLSGYRIDLRRLAEECRVHGAYLIVDAIQGVGALRMDVNLYPVDFLACGGSKWLFSGQGAAFLFVSKRVWDRLRPTNIGWLGVDWPDFNRLPTDLPLKANAARYEEGTRNLVIQFGMNRTLRMLESVGHERIEASVLGLVRRLRDGLTQRGMTFVGEYDPEKSGSGIVTFRSPKVPADRIYEALHARGIITSLREDAIRVSPHFYNTPEEMSALLETLDGL